MSVAESEERFGEYELVRYLVSGGMADLYLVRRPDTDEDLVLKRIQRRYVDHTRVVKLFIDEGRIVRTLDHPNIVRVIDVGDLDGTYYIAMEYIAGHDLIAIARRGVETGRFLPRTMAVGLLAQVATGLAYAHSRTDEEGRPLSIVHCDISPGNVVVSWRGTAKIVDFGIARATIQLRVEDGVLGKYNYMAPEQIRGEAIDARADLFSLGVILYELTLRRRLFKGRPDLVRGKVLSGVIPRPRDIDPSYPEELERILGLLLMGDRSQRYPSAAKLRSDLRAYLQKEEGGWSKKEIARYLRDLFRAPRVAGPEPDGREGDFVPGSEEEELELEHAMPELEEEIEADPELDGDLDEESAAFTSAFQAAPPMIEGASEGTIGAPPEPASAGDRIATPIAPEVSTRVATVVQAPLVEPPEERASLPSRTLRIGVGVALAILAALWWLRYAIHH